MSRRVAHAAIRESSPPAPSWETSFPGTKALRGAFSSWMEAASPDGRPLRRSRKRRAEKPPRSPKRRPLFLQEGDGGAKGPKATAALQVDLLRGGCPAGRLLPVCSRVAEVEIGEEQGEPPAVLWLPPLSPPLYFEQQSGKEGGTPRACVAREREREEEEEKKVRLKKKISSSNQASYASRRPQSCRGKMRLPFPPPPRRRAFAKVWSQPLPSSSLRRPLWSSPAFPLFVASKPWGCFGKEKGSNLYAARGVLAPESRALLSRSAPGRQRSRRAREERGGGGGERRRERRSPPRPRRVSVCV